MARVVMFVANDVSRDTRVLREAAALAGEGHSVTVVGMLYADSQLALEEQRGKFKIMRLPYRARPPAWWPSPRIFWKARQRGRRFLRLRAADIRRVRRRSWRLARIGGSRLRRAGYHTGRFFRIRKSEVARGRYLARRWLILRHPRAWSVLRRLSRRRGQAEGDSAGSAEPGIFRSRDPRAWPGMAWRLLARTPRLLTSLLSAGLTPGGTMLLRSLTGTARIGPRLLRSSMYWGSFLVWAAIYRATNRAFLGGPDWLIGWRFRWFGWATAAAMWAPDADVWHAHDLTSLPAALRAQERSGGKVVYDSHEIYLESGKIARQPGLARSMLYRLEADWIDRCDAVLTVNESVAEVLRHRYRRADIRVVYNCPATVPSEHLAGPGELRAAIGAAKSSPIILYHGLLAPHRGLEELVACAEHPAIESFGAHVVFLGYGSEAEGLRERARTSTAASRLHVLDAVDPGQLPRWLMDATVSVAPIQPSTMNHYLSSPNKVFEAISVGVPVVGSDFPEFRRVIADNPDGPIGALFAPDDPDSLIKALTTILRLSIDARAVLYLRCRRAHLNRWNWHLEAEALLRVYRQLLMHPRSAAAQRRTPRRRGIQVAALAGGAVAAVSAILPGAGVPASMAAGFVIGPTSAVTILRRGVTPSRPSRYVAPVGAAVAGSVFAANVLPGAPWLAGAAGAAAMYCALSLELLVNDHISLRGTFELLFAVFLAAIASALAMAALPTALVVALVAACVWAFTVRTVELDHARRGLANWAAPETAAARAIAVAGVTAWALAMGADPAWTGAVCGVFFLLGGLAERWAASQRGVRELLSTGPSPTSSTAQSGGPREETAWTGSAALVRPRG